MSETMTNPKAPATLTAEDIMNWLKDNPNFLQKHPEALDLLMPPKENKGKGVADFQYYMVQRLKADRDEVVESAREIVETSRANMNNFSRIQNAIVMLLEAQTFEDFIHTITMDFTALLDVDIISLIVETDGETIPHVPMNGVRAVNPGTIDLILKDMPIILEPQSNGLEDIYGGGAGLVKSQALLRLTVASHGPAALVAFGSREPDMFEPGQGTEMIAFLGQVIERCLRSWLDLPPQ